MHLIFLYLYISDSPDSVSMGDQTLNNTAEEFFIYRLAYRLSGLFSSVSACNRYACARVLATNLRFLLEKTGSAHTFLCKIKVIHIVFALFGIENGFSRCKMA